MAHEPDTLQSAYTRIIGETWVDDPDTRIHYYEILSYTAKTRPETLMPVVDNLLTLFDKEEREGTKLEVLEILNNRLRVRQEEFTEQNYEPFYSRLVALTQDKKNAEYTHALIGCGLDVACRERKPSCGTFFQQVISYVATYKGKEITAVEAEYLKPIAQKIGAIACAHPELVTPKYVEANTALLTLPISEDNTPRDKATRRIHHTASLNLHNLIEALGDGELKCPTYKLFTDPHLKVLSDLEVMTHDTRVKAQAKRIRLSAQIWKLREHAAKKKAPTLPEIFLKMKTRPPNAPN